MKRAKDFKILIALVMIVLLNFFISSLRASECSSYISSTGDITAIEQDSVLVSLSAIRKANIKLIEAEQNIQLLNSFQNIVEMQKTQIDILEKNIKDRNSKIVELTNQYKEEVKNSKKYKRQRNIFAGSTGLVILLSIILL
nr:MAG TPA: hemolysin [Crassvirales sp.]